MSSLWLNQRRKNVYSQNGEDGVLEAILEKTGAANRCCCEVGAWDGMQFSNTYNLAANRDWRAIMIEADEARFSQLVPLASPRLLPIQARVSDDLDLILSCTPLPRDFDVLSIDVDGPDYQVWEALRLYRPRIVILEVNSMFPPGVREAPSYGGVSLELAVLLAKSKGYELALHTGNAIFVLRELAPLLDVDAERWQELFDSSWMAN